MKFYDLFEAATGPKCLCHYHASSTVVEELSVKVAGKVAATMKNEQAASGTSSSSKICFNKGAKDTARAENMQKARNSMKRSSELSDATRKIKFTKNG